MIFLWWLLGLHDPATVAAAHGAQFIAVRTLSVWTVSAVALLGLAAAGLNLLPHTVLPRVTRLFLALLRLAGTALILLLLAQVELRLTLDRRVPPSVAVLHDASASMELVDAGGRTRLEAANRAATELAARTSRRVRLAHYAFTWQLDKLEGSDATPRPGSTRIARALAETLQREEQIEAVVILTDGNDTGGDRGERVAPLLASRGVPVYPLLFGRPDAPALGNVRLATAAPYVRLGDTCVLTAHVTATGVAEQTVRLALYEEGVAVALASREQVRVGPAAVPVTFTVRPTAAGIKHYRIAMEGLQGAASTQRLVAEHQVEVIDARIRVLYLDIARDERKILGHWLARDPVVELATLTRMPKGGWYGQGALKHQDVSEGLPGSEADLYQYDVIVLGDIPRGDFRQGGDVGETKLRWLTEFVARRGGGLITLGGRSVYGAGGYGGSALAAILPFELVAAGDSQVPGKFRVEPTVLGLSHPILQIADTAEANRDAWYDLPTLDGCNLVGRARAGASVLAVRPQDGAALPLLAVQEVGKGRVLACAADTTWRWEMLRDAEAPDHYRRFWGNAVRHLAPDPRLQPGQPRIQRDRTNPAVGETLTLSTRLLDPLYQPVRQAALTVQVQAPSGRHYAIYPRDGRTTPGLYTYEVTLDEPGDWTVRTAYKDRISTDVIRAGASEAELEDPRARPDRMQELAALTGGACFTPDQIDELADRLGAHQRPVRQECTVPLWNLPAVLALFFVIICLDCLIRKRRGMV